jgi:hypothetical protein
MALKVISSLYEQEAQKRGIFGDLAAISKTVFTTKDVALLWGEDAEQTITGRLHKYVKAGKLVSVRRGIYAKDENYDRFEMATRIYTPSYVSFETVLTRAGINFQYYDTIFVASYVSRDIYDVWYFLKNNWPLNREIVEQRSGMPLNEFLQKCIDQLEKMTNKNILVGLGESLTDRQKDWARAKLRSDTIFLLKARMESEG